MAQDNPLNATFFAFRKRERGGALFSTAIAFLVLLLIVYGALALLFVTQFGDVISWYGDALRASSSGDVSAMQGMSLPPSFGVLILIYLLALVVFFVAYASFEAACLRWMIRGERKGLFGLSLDADTWRVYATYWMWLLLGLAAYLGAMIIVGVVMAVLFGVMQSSGGVVVAMLAPLLILGVLTYLCVRMAPAAATSIARRKFSFFQAWTVTRGRFWALFGSFLLLLVVYFAISIVVSAFSFSLLLSGSDMNPISMITDPTAFNEAYLTGMASTFSSPASIALYFAIQVVAWGIALVFSVITFGVNSRAAVAAVEDGKIEGLIPETAKTFE